MSTYSLRQRLNALEQRTPPRLRIETWAHPLDGRYVLQSSSPDGPVAIGAELTEEEYSTHREAMEADTTRRYICVCVHETPVGEIRDSISGRSSDDV